MKDYQGKTYVTAPQDKRATAMRENLKRRKEQQRKRDENEREDTEKDRD